MLEKGATQFDIYPTFGRLRNVTILWTATYAKQWDIVRSLLQKGATTVNITPASDRYKEKKTLLSFAAHAQKWDIVDLLLDKGAIDEQLYNGFTVLMLAERAGEKDIVEKIKAVISVSKNPTFSNTQSLPNNPPSSDNFDNNNASSSSNSNLPFLELDNMHIPVTTDNSTSSASESSSSNLHKNHHSHSTPPSSQNTDNLLDVNCSSKNLRSTNRSPITYSFSSNSNKQQLPNDALQQFIMTIEEPNTQPTANLKAYQEQIILLLASQKSDQKQKALLTTALEQISFLIASRKMAEAQNAMFMATIAELSKNNTPKRNLNAVLDENDAPSNSAAKKLRPD